MAKFFGVAASVDGDAIRLRFDLDAPCILGWQIFDPSTGAFLFEGEWTELRDTHVDIRVAMPTDDGPYRVQVAPVQDRARFVLIDAHVNSGAVEMSPPQVTTIAAQSRARLLRA